jgi:DNA-binding PadR family transcriptional regulator
MKSYDKRGYENRIELLQGTLDLMQVETGSLYPALHRLERKKWIKAEWTISENNQKVKSYQLTAAGKKQLAAERSS